MRWQVWTTLLLYVLLRFQAFLHDWSHSFTRLFTLIRGCGTPQHQCRNQIVVIAGFRSSLTTLDTVQETFAAAVRNISSLRDDAKFASWLFGIAHQKCLQHLRRVRRDNALFVTDEDQPAVGRPDPDESSRTTSSTITTLAPIGH